MSLKTIWYSWRVFFGAEICPQCGSENVKQCGYEGHNHRHKCNDCGVLTWFE